MSGQRQPVSAALADILEGHLARWERRAYRTPLDHYEAMRLNESDTKLVITALRGEAVAPLDREVIKAAIRNGFLKRGLSARYEILDDITESVLAALPSEAIGRDLSEQERHAVGHARYQVERATPDNPECCFDYELVGTLIGIIDRASTVSRPTLGGAA